MEDLLFERLDRLDVRVGPHVVLQDLFFLDRVVRPIAGPGGSDYRVPFLVEALESRGFCTDTEARWEAVELYDDLCELCDVRSYSGLERVLERYRRYLRARDSAAVEEPRR
ncbi:MAG TPA: hypothetical protein VM778_02240 [Gemmatimonadota bacterium]|nr:hypothetical protein [Gemmatimonadota bacterium]